MAPALHVSPGSGEPVVIEWTATDEASVLTALGFAADDRPFVLGVNGRSGGGKSTLARRLADAVPGSAVVATDDVAWHLSMFDWSAELIDNIVEPVRRGEAVHYRPPGWVARDRPGEVFVEAGRSLLVVEGVGASQRAMTAALDAAVWVQSDAPTARKLGIARDVASGVNGEEEASIRFWEQWMAAEIPFQETDRPWDRADLILAGVPRSIDGLYVDRLSNSRSRTA